MGLLQTIADGASDWWNNPLTQIGMGLFSTNTGNYGNPNIGAGISTGMNNYASLMEQARQRKLEEEERQRQRTLQERDDTLWGQQQSDRQAIMKATGGIPLDAYSKLNPSEVDFSQWSKMTPEQRRAYEQYLMLQRLNSTNDWRTKEIKNEQYREQLVKQYGSEDHPAVKRFDEAIRKSQWLNTGTAFVNPFDLNSIDIDNKGKKIAEAEGAAVAERLLAFPKAMSAAAIAKQYAQDQKDDVLRLYNITDTGSTGWGALLTSIPMTDAANWARLRDTVVSNIAMEKMQELKMLSANGSTGFGALSEKELKILQDFRGDLSQTNDPKEIKRILERYSKHLSESADRFERAMQEEIEWYENNKKEFSPSNQVDTSKYGRSTGGESNNDPLGIR